MSERGSHQSLAFVVGFLVGAVLGGGLGLLLAPGKGEETRKKLREGSQNLKEKVDEFYENVRGATQPLLEAVGDLEEENLERSVGGRETEPALRETPPVKESLVTASPGLSGSKKRFFKNIRR